MGILSPLLVTRDMKKTIDFYQNTLGFKLGMMFPDVHNPEYADLSKDSMIIMFTTPTGLKIGRRDKLGVGVNLYLQIDDDIDHYYKELQMNGAKINTAIKDEPWGSRDFTIEDNNGYLLTFSQTSRTARTQSTGV